MQKRVYPVQQRLIQFWCNLDQNISIQVLTNGVKVGGAEFAGQENDGPKIFNTGN